MTELKVDGMTSNPKGFGRFVNLQFRQLFLVDGTTNKLTEHPKTVDETSFQKLTELRVDGTLRVHTHM